MARGGTFKSMGAFKAAIRRDMRQLDRGMDRAANRAARKVAAQVRRDIPVAHGELRDSVHVEGTRLVIDAPHAAAVEMGSRPHWMPLQPLIEWVELRGFQGLQVGEKSRARLPGTTTLEHANRIGHALQSSSAAGASEPVMAVARAIQFKIAQFGTKPHWYLRRNLPFARLYLAEEVEALLRSGG